MSRPRILPTEISKRSTDVGKLKILIHGEAGAGKTTFASKFPGALFLATEAGTGHIDSFDMRCASWSELSNACAALQAQEHDFKTVVIDTMDNAWKLCRDHVNAKNGVSHEQDLSFGKGSAMILREFERVFDKLATLGLGLVLITHTATEERTDKKGRSQTRLITAVPKKAREYLSGFVDVILFASTEVTEEGSRRVLLAGQDQDYEAKDRTGKLPSMLSLDFEAFSKCFEEVAVQPEFQAVSDSKPKSRKPWTLGETLNH